MHRVYNPEEECAKLAANIRTICEARRLSVYAASEKAHISKSALADLLNGTNRPQLYTLYKICNALEISIVELFEMNEGSLENDAENDKKEDEKEERNFCITYRYLPEWKKRIAEEHMRMLVEYSGGERWG